MSKRDKMWPKEVEIKDCETLKEALGWKGIADPKAHIEAAERMREDAQEMLDAMNEGEMSYSFLSCHLQGFIAAFDAAKGAK